MKTVHIKNKLKQLGIDPDSIQFGDFDRIGEFTAKRQRGPESEHYKSSGAFFRANYERGILVYNLIMKHEIRSMLEIGFGRGYTTLCAAKAFHDLGVKGRIVTIDPNLDEKFIQALSQIFPAEWLNSIEFIKSYSNPALTQMTDKFDLVYIDGDHSYEGTKFDWENTKDKFNKCLLFDDYHLPTKKDDGIQCRKLIDQIDPKTVDCDEPELIIMDRRLFFDDRKLTDEEINYGQVLLTKSSLNDVEEW